MAKKKKKKRGPNNPFSKMRKSLHRETKLAVLAIIFFVLSVFFILSQFDYAGIVGKYTYKWLNMALGAGYFILPLVFLMLSVSFLKSKQLHIVTTNTIGSILFILSTLGLLDMFSPNKGGYLGSSVGYVFGKFLGEITGSIFLVAILLIALLIIFNTQFTFFRKKKEEEQEEKIKNKKEEENVSTKYNDDETGEESKEGKEYKNAEEADETEEGADDNIKEEKEDTNTFITPQFSKHIGEYALPPLSLLERDTGKPGAGDIKANANIIKRTLANFGIDVEIDEVSIGPSITRYAVKPAEGVRLSRIIVLQNDLSLALAAHPVRIEAPIPGKSLVGIEIPNSKKSTVGLATLLSAREFKENTNPLLVSLGKTVTGTPLFANISKAPHMLIAGATGSGKSVIIHSLISSLLFRNTPHMLRFIMVDPKRVELTLYNGIPHLLTPVITDFKKSILSLKWAIKEMERRYNILETEKVRDIGTYHRNVIEPAYRNANINKDDLPELMPYIVIIIDELADIMSTYPKELEATIVRLAQMSRAVGIHLILSTQRPSVNIITGLIKANIPTRIALQVSSQIDSRTIIDMSGAEKLLGAGDVLYLSGSMSKPVRLQSAFVTEQEVKKVVKFLKKEYQDELQDDLDLASMEQKNGLLHVNFDNEQESEDEDDLYEEAKSIVISAKKASTSYLQRKLGIGYSRAARIIDMLEDNGIVGEQHGSKPREVYIQNEPYTDKSGNEDTQDESEE